MVFSMTAAKLLTSNEEHHISSGALILHEHLTSLKNWLFHSPSRKTPNPGIWFRMLSTEMPELYVDQIMR